MANDHNLIPLTKETAPAIASLGGKAKKGKRHINTWIQELLEDETFEATIQEGYKIVEFKGAPLKAIIKAQMIKAMNGDTKAFDSLAKYGWAQKSEVDAKVEMVQPILGGAVKQVTDVYSDEDDS